MTSLALKESPTWRLTDWLFDRIRTPFQKQPKVFETGSGEASGRDLLLDVMHGHPEAFLGDGNFHEEMTWYHFRQ